MKFLVGLVSVATGAVVPAEFIWNMSRGCNRTNPACDQYYNLFDAPSKSDTCLSASANTCSIWYTTSLNFESKEMCTNEFDLWIDLALGHTWFFRPLPEIRLMAVGANVVKCSNYTVAEIPKDSTTDIPWCSTLPPLPFYRIIFADNNRARIPNSVVLNRSKYLVIRSREDNKACWLSKSDDTTMAIAADYHKSNVGALTPEVYSTLQPLETRLAILFITLVLGAASVLALLRKFRQAALLNLQEAAVNLHEPLDRQSG